MCFKSMPGLLATLRTLSLPLLWLYASFLLVGPPILVLLHRWNAEYAVTDGGGWGNVVGSRRCCWDTFPLLNGGAAWTCDGGVQECWSVIHIAAVPYPAEICPPPVHCSLQVGAVAEAAFMTGMERNGDILTLAAYVRQHTPQLECSAMHNATPRLCLCQLVALCGPCWLAGLQRGSSCCKHPSSPNVAQQTATAATPPTGPPLCTLEQPPLAHKHDSFRQQQVSREAHVCPVRRILWRRAAAVWV